VQQNTLDHISLAYNGYQSPELRRRLRTQPCSACTSHDPNSPASVSRQRTKTRTRTIWMETALRPGFLNSCRTLYLPMRESIGIPGHDPLGCPS